MDSVETSQAHDDAPAPGLSMPKRVASVFIYVDDMVRSVEFYNEVIGAEIVQLHSDEEDGPLTLALLRIGDFDVVLHPQEGHEAEFQNTRVGVGVHLQLRVEDIDGYYHHCLDQGAMLSVSGEPEDQPGGWREFAIKDPDGYVWSVYQPKAGGPLA
jgi:uncharacterized glyoxalase superfamily protein PhnB